MTSFLGDIWLWGANPGRLTREWWDGARAVRLTPLSAVILMLLLQGLVGHMEARYLAVVDPRLNVVIRPMTLMVIAAFATHAWPYCRRSLSRGPCASTSPSRSTRAAS